MTNDIENQIKRYLEEQKDREFDFKKYSHARIGLGHTGGHIKTQHWLNFQSGFSQAKDAVFSYFDTKQLTDLCDELKLESIIVNSQVNDAAQFFLRPDLGKLIAHDDETKLEKIIKQNPEYCYQDLLIILSGGLSPIAIQRQIPLFLPQFIQIANERRWSLVPVIINPKGRVALGDQLNYYFKAKIVIILIGERPGLSTPDSLGIYFTYNAAPGCTNDQRNCISNIHERGLPHKEAALKLAYLINKSLISKLSGVALKDDFIMGSGLTY